MNIKKLVNMFNLNMNYLVEKDDKGRWINVLRQLKEFEEKEVLEEYENILGISGVGKDPLYYLESVRRNLNLKKDQSYKTMPMPKQIKDLFK